MRLGVKRLLFLFLSASLSLALPSCPLSSANAHNLCVQLAPLPAPCIPMTNGLKASESSGPLLFLDALFSQTSHISLRCVGKVSLLCRGHPRCVVEAFQPSQNCASAGLICLRINVCSLLSRFTNFCSTSPVTDSVSSSELKTVALWTYG